MSAKEELEAARDQMAEAFPDITADGAQKRLRIVHVIVQPVLVWDDGNEMTPGPVANPIQVSLADLAALAEKLRAEVAGFVASAEQPS